MAEKLEGTRPFGARASALLDRAEGAYLKLLRAALLVIASGLIAYAAVLATISLYRVLQSPNSVVEKTADVRPEELTAAGAPSAAKSENKVPVANPAQRQAYSQFLASYHELFRTRFEPFRQKQDKQLSRSEFDDNFINTRARLEAVAKGELNHESDLADLNKLLLVMSDAAELPATRQRLAKYRSATKVQVCRDVERTRTTTQRGWDRYSTACEQWFYEPIGCAVTREVQTPYTARECELRFPEGTQSHTQIFQAYQDQFFQLLNRRRESNAAQADAKRLDIIQGIAAGESGLMSALQIAMGFLMLMFFFLLIAIERHQRLIARGFGEVSAEPGPNAADN